METLVITKKETIKQILSDILLDISWAKISKKYFGKSSLWIYNKLDEIEGNEDENGFTYSEKLQLKNALLDLSERIRKASESIDI